MPTTPRVLYPYPDENQDPWFSGFAALMEALDYTAFADREDKNSVMMGGGLMTFTASSGLLTWASGIQILSPIAGYSESIPAGSIVLADGQNFYVSLTRGPLNNIILSPITASAYVPNNDNAYLIGYRRGTTVYFRNGRTINDGDSSTVLTNTVGVGGGGGSGTINAVELSLVSGVFSTSSSSQTRAGSRLIHLGFYPPTVGLLTQSIYFVADIEIATSVSAACTVQLFNVTDSELVTGTDLATGNAFNTEVSSASLTVGVAPGNLKTDKVYEVDIAVVTGVPTDRAIITNARLLITYS